MRFSMGIAALLMLALGAGCEESSNGAGSSAGPEAQKVVQEGASALADGDVKPGLTLAKQIMVDYKEMLSKARRTIHSNRSFDEMYTNVVALKKHYERVMLGHAKKRLDLGKKHFRDCDKHVNRQKELMPLSLSQWIEPAVRKLGKPHPELAIALMDLPVFINYFNLEELKKSDPDRAARLQKQLDAL